MGALYLIGSVSLILITTNTLENSISTSSQSMTELLSKQAEHRMNDLSALVSAEIAAFFESPLSVTKALSSIIVQFNILMAQKTIIGLKNLLLKNNFMVNSIWLKVEAK